MIFALLLLFLSACEKDSGPLTPAGKIRTTKVDPPRSVRIEEGEGNSVDIRWSAPASDAGFSGRYNVQFKRRSNATYKFSYETQERTYNVHVMRDTTYDYRVRSLAAAGWEASDWVSTEYTLTGVAVENSARGAPANAAVSIPDEALRQYLERVLKKNRGATITHADMRTIVNLLEGHTTFQGIEYRLQIKSLVGLEAATNLQNVALGGNNISDVSPLAHLSTLRYLDLRGNQISDVSPLAHLSTLRYLDLKGNHISDVSPLAHLSTLSHLDLRSNQISDVSPLAHLSTLSYLDLRGNPLLSDASIDEHIPALQQRGVEVVFTPHRLFEDRDSPFDIELVFLDDFPEIEQETWHQIAHRWEAAIQMDLPDYTFSARRNLLCGDHSISIPAGEQIDDLRIYIVSVDAIDSSGRVGGFGGPQISRRSSSMPIIGCVGIGLQFQGDSYDIWRIGLHEIGHVLGIGTTWDRMIRDLNGDTHFAGPQAIAAFDQAGGSDYQGAKVPTGLQYNRSHWRAGVMSGDLMTSGISSVLSAITLGALSDLGYTVDFSMADPYELPPPGAAKPIADAVPFCSLEVEGLPPPVYVDD